MDSVNCNDYDPITLHPDIFTNERSHDAMLRQNQLYIIALFRPSPSYIQYCYLTTKDSRKQRNSREYQRPFFSSIRISAFASKQLDFYMDR